MDQQQTGEQWEKAYRAIGIDICESNIWGRHIGTNALRAFIRYYAELGCRELYTQTWSGNVHMIRVAETLGFQECNRLEGEREVRGETYDGLTFVLKM